MTLLVLHEYYIVNISIIYDDDDDDDGSLYYKSKKFLMMNIEALYYKKTLSRNIKYVYRICTLY